MPKKCPCCKKRHERPKRSKYYSKGRKVYVKEYFPAVIKRFVKKCKTDKAALKSVMRLNA